MSDNPNVPHDTEDKKWWLKHGEKLENKFCIEVAPKYGLDAKINPAKIKDSTAPDLIVDGNISDLKVQQTPFFTAGRYNKNPRLTVTFNWVDQERYLNNYPDIEIYFFVNWKQLKYRNIKLQPLKGLWKTNPKMVQELIQSNKAPLHSYRQRVNDTQGNAKSSYLLSLSDLIEIKIK